MDGLDPESGSESLSPGSISDKRGRPNCGNCRNHGIIVPLRGHKQDCPHRGCECECCILTRLRREVMAKQSNLSKQKRLHGRRDPDQADDADSSHSTADTTPPANRAEVSSPNPRLIAGPGFDLEMHSCGANELIKTFKLDMTALPFAYAVMSVAGGQLHTAYSLLAEASDEANSRHPPRPAKEELYRAGPSAFSNVSHRSPDRRDNNPRNYAFAESSREHNTERIRGNYYPRRYDPYSRDSSVSPPPR